MLNTKKKLLDLLQDISYAHEEFTENLKNDDSFWKKWSKMHKYISDLNDVSNTICLTEGEVKTLKFYLEKAKIDAEGMCAIGIASKQSVKNINSILDKASKLEGAA